MTIGGHCSVLDCGEPPVAVMERDALCLAHFLSICYKRLDEYDEIRKGSGLIASDGEDVRGFIHECTRQADEIGQGAKHLANLDRAKLLHISLTASELGCYLRRSPRKAASMAVRISSERLGAAWEEDTETVLLSRYGASVRCSHPAKPGETIMVARTDTGQFAAARVVWQRLMRSDDLRIGIEFLNSENFWGLDWEALEARHIKT